MKSKDKYLYKLDVIDYLKYLATKRAVFVEKPALYDISFPFHRPTKSPDFEYKEENLLLTIRKIENLHFTTGGFVLKLPFSFQLDTGLTEIQSRLLYSYKMGNQPGREH
ncbi:hypothetical protein TI03_07180, partial [Achromatium sp. WMS1]